MAKKKKKPPRKKMGAPTKYKEEYCSRDYLQGYFDECMDEDKPKLISLCGFACYVGVTEVTLATWGEKYPDFLCATRLITQRSKEMLLNGGIYKHFNPLITKLCLSANHGMREGTDITSGGEAITIQLPEKFKDI